MDGFDDVTIRVQNPPQPRHLHLKIALFYDGVGPNSAHDLFFFGEDARGLDQHHHKIEGTAAELDRLLIAQQLASSRQYAEAAKPNDGVAAHAYPVPTGARRIPSGHRLAHELSESRTGGEGLAVLEHYVRLLDCHLSDSLYA